MKKIIVVLTLGIIAVLWWHHRPLSIDAAGSDISYTYTTRKMNARAESGLPLIIALHGNGDTTENFQKTLFHDLPAAARMVFIEGPYPYRSGHAWPMSGAELRKYGEALAEIIIPLSEKYSSPQKPVLVGFSGGGCMAYYQAAVHPDLYSAIIAVSGRLDASLIGDAPEDEYTANIVAIHGKADTVIRFNAGKNAVAALEKLGRAVDMIELPGGHLSVFTTGHHQFIQVLQGIVQHET